MGKVWQNCLSKSVSFSVATCQIWLRITKFSTLTCIWISWDYVSCPCYYETGGRHTPDDTTLVAFCMVRSCNWPKRRSYPTTWGRHSIGTSPCRERFDQLPGLSRHSQWLVIPWKNNKKIVKLTWVVRGCTYVIWQVFMDPAHNWIH